MADQTIKWNDIHDAIVQGLNIPVEYQALGLHLANGAHPNSKGWVAAHAHDCEDRTPSAGINVNTGRYKSFRDGLTCSIFDFAMKVKGCTFTEALRHYAHIAGYKLPEGVENSSVEKIDVSKDPQSTAILLNFPAGKPGVTARALQEVGSKLAMWPKGLSAEYTNQVLATPMYGSALLDLEPVGWHCVAQKPTGKIRIYQGKGKEQRLEKVMTVGTYGLMNNDGLHRLEAATVVNIVEGISDLYAGQAVLGPWRDEDPDGRKHVVLSAGGCSCHPKPEWMQHFAGKEVRVWFDVGDGNNEGQIGAAVWVGSLLQVANVVRNVQLPLGKDGGKNDLRAWLTEADANRGYAEMDAYAQTFDPVDPGDKEAAGLTPMEALLKNLGIVVIGEYENSQWIEVYCETTKKSGPIHDIDKLTFAKLIQLVGSDPVMEHVHDGKEPQPDKYQLKDVKNAIAAAASDKLYYSEQKHGAGVWDIDGEIVIVKAREVGIPKGTVIERSAVPFYNGHILDTSQSVGDWCDFNDLNRFLAEAQRDAWCQEVFEEADRIFGKWHWREKSAPRVVTSLVICSFLQTLWPWRPEIFITGGSDTGKSMLVEDTLSQGIFGSLAMYVQKPTEAAICQHMKHHGRVLIIDEFEQDKHRQAILELLRVTSRGGKKIRGTVDHRGTSFTLRHIPWLAAIEMGLRKQADRNRFIIFELAEIPADRRGKIDLPTTDRLRELGQKLLAVGLRHYERTLELAKQLKRTQVAGVHGRVVENFSLPAAMFAAIFGLALPQAAETMRGWLAQWDFTDQSSRDDTNVLQEILTSEVVLDGGGRSTVSMLLGKPLDPDATSALARVGIKRPDKRGPLAQEVIFFVPEIIRRQLLQKSDYQQHSIQQYLMRLPGAKNNVQHRMGIVSPRGIEVPEETIKAIFASKDEGQDTDNLESGESDITEGF